MKRCVIYTRKSVAFRLDINYNTLESQEDICKRFIRQRRHQGWSYRRTYCDAGVSGGHTERAALQELLADARAGCFDYLVVFKLDRLARRIRDFVCLLEELGDYGVDVVSVTENFDFSGPMGKAQRVLLGVFAEWERENLRERCREWAESARMRGYYLGSMPPYGYVWENRLLQPDPARAEVVKHLFRRYVEGEGSHILASELNRRGVGKRPRGNRPPAPWCSNNVLGILHNPVYAGFIRCRGKLYAGVHEPLITRELWDKVQQLLQEHESAMQKKLRAKGRGYTYPLRGLLVCAECGRRMRPLLSTGCARGIRYYVCSTRQYGGCTACSAPWLRADKVEKLLWQWLEKKHGREASATAAAHVFDTVVEKLVYYGKSASLVVHLKPDVGCAMRSCAQNTKALRLPWMLPSTENEQSPPGQVAVDMAHAILLEEILCTGAFSSIRELAHELKWSYCRMRRLLEMLNAPPGVIENVLNEI